MPPRLARLAARAAAVAALFCALAAVALAAPRHGTPVRIDSGKAPSGGTWRFFAQQFGRGGACARLRLPDRSLAEACRRPGQAAMKPAVGVDVCGDTFVTAVTTRGVTRVMVKLRSGRLRTAHRYPAPPGVSFRGWFYLAVMRGNAHVQRIRGFDSAGHTVRVVAGPPIPAFSC